MIKLEKTEVMGWEAAIRGMRNPLNSWHLSDSYWGLQEDESPINPCDEPFFFVGEKDHDLMTRLRNAGTDHRKFMRMVAVYVDITAPLYWWKEFDTYKVGTVANSCSTMHKIHDKEFTLDDFSHEHLEGLYLRNLNSTIKMLNDARAEYFLAKEKPMKEESKRAGNMKRYWWQMIQLLPTSYNQKRTIMLNYEVLANIYRSRKAHKLDEWHDLCHWIEELPYSELITG